MGAPIKALLIAGPVGAVVALGGNVVEHATEHDRPPATPGWLAGVGGAIDKVTTNEIHSGAPWNVAAPVVGAAALIATRGRNWSSAVRTNVFTGAFSGAALAELSHQWLHHNPNTKSIDY